MDAIVFSGEEVPAGRKVFTHAQHSMRLKPNVEGGEYCSMLGAAAVDDGLLHSHLKRAKGINQDDVISFLGMLAKYYKGRKLAIFCDNGSSFKANAVKWAATDLGI